jgi:hypothetical protein
MPQRDQVAAALDINMSCPLYRSFKCTYNYPTINLTSSTASPPPPTAMIYHALFATVLTQPIPQTLRATTVEAAGAARYLPTSI